MNATTATVLLLLPCFCFQFVFYWSIIDLGFPGGASGKDHLPTCSFFITFTTLFVFLCSFFLSFFSFSFSLTSLFWNSKLYSRFLIFVFMYLLEIIFNTHGVHFPVTYLLISQLTIWNQFCLPPSQPKSPRTALWLKSMDLWSEVKPISHVRLCDPTDSSLHQAPLSMGYSRQEYWSRLPFPSPGNLPDPGIEPRSPAL